MSAPTASADAAEQAAPHLPPDPLREAELAALWSAIAELPRAQREAFLLREIRGLSYEQLGRHLALSRPSIRSLLERARRRIRLRLRDVHTAVGGVPWLEAAARLVAGGSNPAAPVARVAALGLGAAAITGGAIVTPTMLEHHVRPPVVREATDRPQHVSVRLHATHLAVPGVAAATPAASIVLVDRRVRGNRGERSPASEAERTEHHGTAEEQHDRRRKRRDRSGASPSPTEALPTGSSSGDMGRHGSDSHGGETTTTSSTPGRTSTVSPVIAAPTVSSGGRGGDSHGEGGTSSGGDGSSGSTDLGGSHGSDSPVGH